VSDAEPLDGGTQYERTGLAHWRTMLATIVAGLLIIRQSDPGAERVIALVGGLGALLTIGGVGLRRQAALQRGESTVRSGSFVAIVVALVVLQVVALVVVV
jgi:hypothetical protein